MASRRGRAACARCARPDAADAAPDAADALCRQCARPAGADPRSACSSPVPAAGPGPAAARGLRAVTRRAAGRPARFRRLTAARPSGVPKGKSRRIIFKKSAVKAPQAVATPVTSNYLFSKGVYYQVGDIVSVVSMEGDIYFAQIRGLMQDQYCEKSAVITWLLPTEASPPPEQGFDPSTYTIGPDEEIPRRLDCMQLVCNAPSDYYKLRHSPYPTVSRPARTGFVFTRLGPQPIPVERAKEYMV